MAHPRIVSRNKWLLARKKLLVREKKVMGQQDALAAERRRLPMVAIDEPYVFESEDGSAKSNRPSSILSRTRTPA